MSDQFEIKWLEGGREPQCEPNPDFPDGRDVECPYPVDRKCKVELPYPAARCGTYIVTCNRCRLKLAITTAGRPDDPRSVEMPCKELRH